MNTQSNAARESALDQQSIAPPAMSTTRPFYWSVRRELWEYRSIYIAPLAVSGLFLFGFLLSTIHLPEKMRALVTLDPMKQHELIEQPYNFAALLIMGSTFIVAIFYCLEALHGERRDRSILFWKSLPVSDLTTVLSKAIIPIVILPLVTVAITVVTQWIMLLLSTVVLLGNSTSLAMLRTHLSIFQRSMMVLYHLVVIHGLWFAPFYGWLLLVSAWARRAALLWAVLPLLAIGVVEKIAFNTSYFANLLAYRFMSGGELRAFPAQDSSMDPITILDFGKFLVTPGLWLGLGIAAAFLAAAVRLRRYREPI